MSVYKEVCARCSKALDVDFMLECLGCGKLICVKCCVSEQDLLAFIRKTEKGSIITGRGSKDENGPCGGWVCGPCFQKETGNTPRVSKWTQDSPSSGETPTPSTETPLDLK